MLGYGGGWGTMPWWGWGGMLLFWIAAIVLVAWAIRALNARQRADRDPALAALRLRYASGAIGEAEYEQARRVLARDAIG